MANGRIDLTGSPTGPQSAPPDPRGRVMELSTIGDKRDILQQQIAQANALRNQKKRHYSTWGGALAGGLGDVIDSANSKVQEDQLRAQEAPLIDQQGVLRKDFDSQLQDALGRGAPGQMGPDTSFAQAPQSMAPGPSDAMGPMQGPAQGPIPYPSLAGMDPSTMPMQGPEPQLATAMSGPPASAAAPPARMGPPAGPAPAASPMELAQQMARANVLRKRADSLSRVAGPPQTPGGQMPLSDADTLWYDAAKKQYQRYGPGGMEGMSMDDGNRMADRLGLQTADIARRGR